jgi:hypothetical protein
VSRRLREVLALKGSLGWESKQYQSISVRGFLFVLVISYLPDGGGKMEIRQDKDRLVDQRAPYEPPKATFVPIKITERLMNCGFNVPQGCGSNSYYQ